MKQGIGLKFSKVGDSSSQLEFTDLQKLNQFSELLLRISHALTLNTEVLTQLSQVAVARAEELQDPIHSAAFKQILLDCETQHRFLRHHVTLVKENADRLSVQVCLFW